ncbi:HEM-1/HEM-2 family protein [Streptomyces sp. NBC_01016]|nr:HEM-1/HEM-2 family protein [Streptomyces sp. NBC_01016]
MYAAGSHAVATTLVGVLVVFHALSWDRVVWLFRH